MTDGDLAKQVRGCAKLRADWIMHLRAAIDDVDLVALDMLAPPHERRHGPARHLAIYTGAAGKLAFLLANLPPEPDEYSRDSRQRVARILEMAEGWTAQRAADIARMEREEEEESRR